MNKKIAEIRDKKEPNTTLKKTFKRKKNAQIRTKKAPNTILKILCEGKKMQKFQPKNHLTLSYKN